MTSIVFSQSATIRADVLRKSQYPPPAESGVGSTRILGSKGFMEENSATVRRSVFIRDQYPEPAPNKIGQQDLPGGFKKSNVISGQNKALYNLSRGIIQIDGVAVLFDARA